MDRVVVDTNIFVGAGFSPDSASGRIVEAIREGRLGMPWSEATRSETERVLRKIPPLDWSRVVDLFREKDRISPRPDEKGLDWIEDPTDRKFAALARDAQALLVSNDRHLLEHRDRAGFRVMSSGEFHERMPA